MAREAGPTLNAPTPLSPPSQEPDPAELLLPAETGMDAVILHTGDLDGMTAYYREALGLEVMPAETVSPQVSGNGAGRGGSVTLGRSGVPLVVLVHTPGLPQASPGQSGLFHTAVLFADRTSLAATVLRAASHPRSRFVGSADHLVSLAFYFTDPEGNGIELYWDRPREEWAWHGDRIDIATLPLDPQAFLAEHLVDRTPTAATEVGHVHLKVGDIETARRFYIDALGFRVTAELPGALFFSAGGYHHHMAVNTWRSAGSGPRAATIGLGQVSIAVPGRAALDAAAARLARYGIAVRDDGRALRLADPWGTLVELSDGSGRGGT